MDKLYRRVTKSLEKWCQWRPIIEIIELIEIIKILRDYLNVPGLYTPLFHPFLSSIVGRPLDTHAVSGLHVGKGKRDILHVHNNKSGNLFCKNIFCGLQVVQFECPRVIHPLLSFNFGVHCVVPFPVHAVKGKC